MLHDTFCLPTDSTLLVPYRRERACDILMIEEVSEMIQEIAHAHELNTIIIVSHDIVATASVSDTVWLMGRDRDANGHVIPGARIKHTYDLAEMDLCWEKEDY